MKDAGSGLEEFDIEFVKLKDGLHEFRFRLDKPFFEAFGNEDVLAADVQVDVELEKFPTLMNLNMRMAGTTGLSCDRCLEKIDLPVDTRYMVIYKQESEGSAVRKEDEDTDLVLLTSQDYKINIAQEIYESVLLAVPMIKNCDQLDQKPCNQEMLSKLNELAGEEDNQSDPRWEKLKELLKKEKEK